MRRPGSPYFANSLQDGIESGSNPPSGTVLAKISLGAGRWHFEACGSAPNSSATVDVKVDGALRYKFHLAFAPGTITWQMIMRTAGIITVVVADNSRPANIVYDLVATQIGDECD